MKKIDARVRVTEVDDVSDRLLSLFRQNKDLQSDDFLRNTFGDIQTVSDQITEAIHRDVAHSRLDEADVGRKG